MPPVHQPELQPVHQPELQPVHQPELQPVHQPELQPVHQPELQPVHQPELQPVHQPELPPVHQPELQPVHQPELQPVHQPELPPVHQPELPPVHQPELQPVHQPELQPVHQPELPPVHQPELQPVHQPELPPVHQPELPPVHQPELQPVHQPELPPVHQPELPPVHQPELPPVHQPELQPVHQPELPPVHQPELPPACHLGTPPVHQLDPPPPQLLHNKPLRLQVIHLVLSCSVFSGPTLHAVQVANIFLFHIPDPCSSQPCGRGATCENRRGEDFVCLCLPGDFYNNNTNSCAAAKVFPGELEIQNLTFNELLTDKTSELFKNTSENVSRDIEGVFTENDAYLTSIVLEFLPRSQQSRQAVAIASVQIIFGRTATINKDGVLSQLKNCNKCTTVRNGTFRVTGLCSAIPCDLTTARCEDGDDGNYTCSCQDGFFTTNFMNDRMCIACPSGQQFVDNECIDCPLGYSGFNCGENWELVLLIVGPVLGGVLLITLILLITGAVRSKKHRKASSTADIGTPFISHQSTKAPLINGSKGVPAVAGMPSIPRATAHNSPYSSTNLEMTPSNSRQNLITNGRNSRHHEDYGQSRPQNNPYTQIRPVSSSYTPNQGFVNPYYKNDSR
uniref:Uncharacterized protein n=1 Tax=Takifugu rubripes TaxID=31033 RepID=A0A674PAG2_TAKRU